MDGKITIVSRFHYDILLYFNKPQLDNGKPVIDFLLPSHTPIAYSESESSVKLDIRNNTSTNWIGIHVFKALFLMYKQLLRKTTGRVCKVI